MSRYATIIATGAYLPEHERPNSEMRPKFGEVIDKFEASTSIKRRLRP
jgi:3-oxoacyl-[acyl-carrier-protein] synthase III